MLTTEEQTTVPVVSVIMPAYGAESFIEDTVRSVIAQTYRNWELIIVDDASPDRTGEIADRMARTDDRIKVLHRETSSGRAGSPRNLALTLASGRYVAFLDADDRWQPQKLERQIAFMQAQEAEFAFTAYSRVNHSGKVQSVVNVPRRISRKELLKTNRIGCSTVILDRSVVKGIVFDENSSREDHALWLRLLEKIPFAYGLNEILGEYRIVPGSSSRNKIRMAIGQWRLYRDSAGLSLPSAIWYMCTWALFGYLRNR